MRNGRDIGINLVEAGIGGLAIGPEDDNGNKSDGGREKTGALILIDAAWRRWRKPEMVARQLDDVCRYIVTTRSEVEAIQQADFVLGKFSPPPPGVGGQDGTSSNEDVGQGYDGVCDLRIM